MKKKVIVELAKALRDRFQIGLYYIKKALEECDCDIDKAEQYIIEKEWYYKP